MRTGNMLTMITVALFVIALMSATAFAAVGTLDTAAGKSELTYQEQ